MGEDIEGAADDISDQAPVAFTETKDVGRDNEYLSNYAEVKTWFHKVENFLDHTNSVSTGLVDKLSDFLSLGCSSQMHMMKNKSIKKGFKFLAISCKGSRFIYQFFPVGGWKTAKFIIW